MSKTFNTKTLAESCQKKNTRSRVRPTSN